MDMSGNEVTLKIRKAITEKLIELGVYVDEELPDYIMVMVANKKSLSQMTDDLYLFLGENTQGFTKWIHEVLESLETGKPVIKEVKEAKVVLSVEVSQPVVELKKDDVARISVETHEDNDLISFQNEAEQDDLLSKELESEVAVLPKIEAPMAPDSSTKKQSMVSPVQRSLDSHPRIKAPKPDSTKTSMRVKPLLQRRGASSTVSSTVHKVARLRYISSDEEDEYDPCRPKVGNVASIVKVRERRPTVPVDKQANKLLLLKAIADANKSTQRSAKIPVKVEPYKPTPIARLTQASSPVKELLNEGEEMESQQIAETGDISDEDMTPQLGEEGKVVVEEMEEEMPPPVEEIIEEYVPDGYVPSISKIDYAATKSIPVETVEPLTFKTLKRKLPEIETINLLGTTKADNTQFVVTLDGVNPQELLSNKRKRHIIPVQFKEAEFNPERNVQEFLENDLLDDLEYADDELYDEDEESGLLSEFGQISPVKKKERCQFWPTCSKGDQCIYRHPTKLCKKFPNCNYGPRCKAIHPNCKYDRRCTKPECPFTHTSKPLLRLMPPPPQPRPVQFIQPVSLLPCKFYPSCSNASCPYSHPKACFYGVNCRNPGCQFLHKKLVQSIPKPNKLKWVSPAHILTTSERKYTKPQAEVIAMSVQIIE